MTALVAARDEAGVRVLAVSGDVDHATAPAVEREVRRLVTGAEAVALDLACVGYLDSAGVTLLDRIAWELGRRAVPFRFVVPDGTPARVVLRVVGLDCAMLAGGLDAALADLRPAFG